MQRAVVTVEMFMDVSCPWCHGALETNRRLLDELAADPGAPALKLRWRFQRLHDMPQAGGVPLDEYYRTLVGSDEAAMSSMRDEVQRYATSVGVRVDDSRFVFLHDPSTAHQLLAAVRDDPGDDQPGLWSLARALFTANFVHGVDVSDLAALRGATERFGLAVASRTWTMLSTGDGYRTQTRADHDRALEAGIDGVPRMLVGRRVVPTWGEPDGIRRALREAVADAAADAATTA